MTLSHVSTLAEGIYIVVFIVNNIDTFSILVKQLKTIQSIF